MNSFRRLHSDQDGAVALLVLVGVLICLLLAMTVFDATIASRQKIDVQTAADTAAWSQSAVEARTMNMMAFSNVAKRITVGMAIFYQTTLLSWLELFEIVRRATALQALVCLVTIEAGCPNAEALKKTIQVGVEIALVEINEAPDAVKFFTKILPKIKKDVKSFDAYQAYQAKLAPWHSWAEGTMRGSRNGATAVGLYPVPQQQIGNATNIGSGLEDRLPIQKSKSNSQLCTRSMAHDTPIFVFDYAAKNLSCNKCTKDIIAPKGTRTLLHTLAAGFTAFQYPLACRVGAALEFGKSSKPWEMEKFSTEREWLTRSSNIAFSYRAGSDFAGLDRKKFDIIGQDYAQNPLKKALYESDGFFGVAAAEISFQGHDPDLWHASWSVRMRPVALPTQWSDGDRNLVTAYNDVLPYLVVGAELNPKVTRDNETTDLKDFVRGEMAFDAFSGDNIHGFTR